MKNMILILMILWSTQVYADKNLDILRKIESELRLQEFINKLPTVPTYYSICEEGYLFLVSSTGNAIVQIFVHGVGDWPPQPMGCNK